MKNSLLKKIVAVIIIFVSLALFFGFIEMNEMAPERVSLGQLADMIEEGKVERIVVIGNHLEIFDNEDNEFIALKESDSSLSESLAIYEISSDKLRAVDIGVETPKDFSWVTLLLITFLPIILIIAFFLYMTKQAKKGGGLQSMEFTKANARLFSAEDKKRDKTTFGDVAGLKEVKEELQEVIEFLKSPTKFHAMGAKIPKGVLLVGPAGVGKTLLARAIAGEADVNFFHTSGSSFVELFVGTGAARIRDLFATAKKNSPAIIFIDELDAVGRMRGTGIGGGHDEREQTLNQLLVEMDGFEKNANVIVISATNRPDVLDSALLRPGRFDRMVVLDNPDVNDREEILKIHCKDKPLASDVKIREVAERTPGFSGADLANVANEAAILATRRERSAITQTDILESIEKVLLGPERKSHILSKEEKELSAYHEVGHALVSTFLEKAVPVRKISIISRGSAAGYTIKMPEEEKKIKTKSEFMAEMAALLGGYCAEKIKYREVSSGSSNDLQKVSAIAKMMVRDLGMSSLGPISFDKGHDSLFLGRELAEGGGHSDKVASEIDEEISKLVFQAEKMATDILKEKKSLLEKVTGVLIKKETIEREEFEKLVKGA